MLLGFVVLFSLFRYGHALAKQLLEAPFIDFAHYYTYATVVRMGLNPFDTASVAHVDQLLKIRRAGSAANYPPLFYVLMQPWTLLSFRQAALLWFTSSQVCLLWVMGICLRRFPSPSPIGVAASLFILLNYQPLFESLALGQSNVLLLLLVSLAWWGIRRERSWVTAGAVAVAIHIKVQFGLMVAVLFWIGQRRAAVQALLLTGVGVGAALLVLGPAHYREYLGYLLSPPDYLHTWTANLSLRATLFRALGFSGNGHIFANGLILALDAVLLGVFALATPRTTTPDSVAVDWAWGIGLAAIMLLSPLTEEHHLVVLLLPLFLLWLRAPAGEMQTIDWTLLIASTLLLGSRYSFEQFPAFHQGPLSLLASGKLAGVALLAWALIRHLRK
jgi:hypothetical protein